MAACSDSLFNSMDYGVCSDSRWLHTALSASTRSWKSKQAPFTFINVGVNKGYNVAEVLALLQERRNGLLQPKQWHKALLEYHSARPELGRNLNLPCGLCSSCTEHVPPLANLGQVSVHAFEMLPKLASWLDHARSRFALNDSLQVLNMAVSSSSGESDVKRSSVRGFGFERTTLGDTNTGQGHGRAFGPTARLESYIDLLGQASGPAGDVIRDGND